MNIGDGKLEMRPTKETRFRGQRSRIGLWACKICNFAICLISQSSELGWGGNVVRAES